MGCILSSTSYRVALAVTLILAAGCDPPPAGNTGNSGLSRQSPNTISDGAIVSDGPITIVDGNVTYGRPQVDEAVEKQIYKSLSYFKNLAESIEKRVPGGNRGSRQSREDYATAATSFKLRYELTDSDLDAILRKGDAQGWPQR